MKKIINWFKDIMYNFTDYAIILCVIAAVAAILIWRFDILFDLKVDKDVVNTDPPIEITDNTDTDSKDDNTTDNNDGNNSTDNSDNTDTDKDNTTDDKDNSNNTNDQTSNSGSNNTANGTEIKFNIPAGSFPSKIADVLIANGLIDDKQVFLTRCVELGLDTKLKSGDFTIKKGTSLDDIIKTIAK